MKYVIDHSKTSGNEYELDACFHWDYWALPICIYWWKYEEPKGLYTSCLGISVHILCFSFHFEWWKWEKKGK